MKYLVIPYIALGSVLSMTIGIEYNCTGQEMFPTYYASPFVFKQTSLGSSMEYFYSIFGLIFNILTWSLVLYLIDKGIKRIKKIKTFEIVYKVIIGLLIAFSTLNIAMDSVLVGHGFEEKLNFWYWDMDKEAENWGMTCEGQFMTFKK